MNKSTSRIVILTKRNIKEILRDPLSLIFAVLTPLVLEVLFYLIFHDLTAQFEMKYLAPGIVVFSQTFLTLFTGLLIAVDRQTSFLTRLYVSGAGSHEFIFGYAFAVLPIGLSQAILFFLVGGLIDPTIFGAGMLWSVLLSSVSALFFIGLGILFGSLCGEKSIGGVSSVVITGQSVLSGMWFPTEGLGEGMISAMRCLPFKNATDAVRNALIGTEDALGDILIPMLIVAGYAAVAIVAAIVAFGRRMKDN